MTPAFNYLSDRPASEDAFGRKNFSASLARSLLLTRNSDGLVVGIEGSWGSGKSTLFGFIKNHLEESVDNCPIVIQFNPWMVSTTGALIEALIGQIAASIGEELSFGEKGIAIGQKLLDYVGLLRHLKYLSLVPSATISALGHSAEAIATAAQTIGSTADEGVESGEKALKDVKKLLPTLDLSKKRSAVIKALSDFNRPIVVMIDDLDRLPADEIRSMIQAIKAVGDFPHVTYLLAYDRSIIAKALAVDEESGISYLEKIVQVAYPIPPLFQRQLKTFALHKIQTVLNQLKIVLRDYEKGRFEEAMSLLTKLCRQPRDVVRTVNRLILSLPATFEEVNVSDVIVIEAISQRFPALREAIHTHPADFIGHHFRGDLTDDGGAFDWDEYSRDIEDKEEGESWEKHLPAKIENKNLARQACKFLFAGKDRSSSSFKYEDHLRIADPDRLARYFRLTSLEDVPEVKAIHALLENPLRLEEALTDEYLDQLPFLLEWIENYLPSCTTLDARGSIQKLIDVSQKLSQQGQLTNPIAKGFAQVIERLLETLERNSRERYELFVATAELAPLPVGESIVLRAAAEQGKWAFNTQYRKSENDQFIQDQAIVDKAVEMWSNRVRQRIGEGQLHKETNLYSVLHRFAQFNNSYAEVYVALSSMFESNEGLASFLAAFDSRDSIFNIEELSLVEDPEKLANLIRNSNYSEKYQWLIKTLEAQDNVANIRAQAERHKNGKYKS